MTFHLLVEDSWPAMSLHRGYQYPESVSSTYVNPVSRMKSVLMLVARVLSASSSYRSHSNPADRQPYTRREAEGV